MDKFHEPCNPESYMPSSETLISFNLNCSILFQIKDIYKFRAETKEWHCCKPPSEYEDILSMHVQVMLADRDSRGRRVYVTKVGEGDYILILCCILLCKPL
jgi:hypothetical protein